MEERTHILRTMQICRFCLDEKGPFGNIYDKSVRLGKSEVALPLQVMACAAIEVYQSDGMPPFICNRCSSIFNEAYRFKKSCKRSEEALRNFLMTGNLIKPKTSMVGSLLQQSGAQKRSIGKSNLQTVIGVPQTPAHDSTPYKIAKIEKVAIDSEPEEPLDAGTEADVGDLSNEESQDVLEAPADDIEAVFVETDESSALDSPKVPQVETHVYPCEQCERTFPLKQLLELHEKNHERERSNPCELCERSFFTKYDLAKHVQSHTMAKPFSCVACGKAFAREPLLHRHEQTHADSPKYVCGECDKRFLARADFEAHAERHRKKRPFNCRLCDKRFVFKQGLERHEASHADEKPHKCNYCEASFTSPIKLMRHITSHAGLRPYPCKVCGRTFLLSHHLTRHLRGHYAAAAGGGGIDAVGQHKCDVCSMSFRRKDSLINHSAIHSMVNLKCVICNTAFGSAKEVKAHITTHLAGLPYPCDKCDYSFDTQEQLEEHELKHAEMEYEEQIEKEVSNEALEESQTMAHDADDDDSDADGEITEYTITNDDENNPQVVPRKRKAPPTTYATFLKEEIGSDAEIVIEHSVDGDDEDPDGEDAPDAEGIKPIVRSEGTKVYARKSSLKKSRSDANDKSGESSLIADATSINLDSLGLTQELVKELPTEQYVDMKFGDVIYKVKKITLKKTEFDAVAKQGNVQVKDGMLVKKTIKSAAASRLDATKSITIESIIDEPRAATPKQVVKKTYVRKPSPGASQLHRNEEEANVTIEMVE